MLTWEAVAGREPRLSALLEQANLLNPKGIQLEAAYVQFKKPLSLLVGWERPKQRGGPNWMFDTPAYEVALLKIRGALKARFAVSPPAPKRQFFDDLDEIDRVLVDANTTSSEELEAADAILTREEDDAV